MPRLLQRWPGAARTFSRAAGLQAEAMQCLQALADLDVKAAATGHAHILEVTALQRLDEARLKNALRGWIRTNGLQVPGKKMLEHIVEDLVHKEAMDTAGMQRWAGGEVRRYRDHLYLLNPRLQHDPSQVLRWRIDRPLVIHSLNRVLHRSDLPALRGRRAPGGHGTHGAVSKGKRASQARGGKTSQVRSRTFSRKATSRPGSATASPCCTTREN